MRRLEQGTCVFHLSRGSSEKDERRVWPTAERGKLYHVHRAPADRHARARVSVVALTIGICYQCFLQAESAFNADLRAQGKQ